ncbi:Auxilin-related protein 1 [Linum perenne]
MDDFPGILARDFGFKPQGKSAPMAPPRNSNTTTFSSSFGGPEPTTRSASSLSSKSSPVFDDHDRGGDGLMFNDVFGGPPKYGESRGGNTASSSSSFDYDSIFKEKSAKSSLPVFDKPVYDDDIFDGLPGLKSSSSASSATKFDDVFATVGSASPPKHKSMNSSAFDDLLGNLGKKGAESRRESPKVEKDSPAFDDLLPGFGRSSSPSVSRYHPRCLVHLNVLTCCHVTMSLAIGSHGGYLRIIVVPLLIIFEEISCYRSTSESSRSTRPTTSSVKTAPTSIDDPFVVLESTSTPAAAPSESFPDPLDEIGRFNSSGSTNVDSSHVHKGSFDDFDPLDNLSKSVPSASSKVNERAKERSPLRSGASMGSTFSPATQDTVDKYPVENSGRYSQNNQPINDFEETPFGMASGPKVVSQPASAPPSYANVSANDTFPSPISEEVSESADEIWLTVSEIPLFTKPTSAPPPSRPPPPRPPRLSARKKFSNEQSFSNSRSPRSAHASKSPVSQFDELDDFAMGRTQNNVNDHADIFAGEEGDTSAAASAAAMKDAMDKAEAKIRHMRERDYMKASRSKESAQADRDMLEAEQRELRERQERVERERQQSEREVEEREQRRLREIEREREEREKEQKRQERERARARQAVDRANREARERAAAEAQARAERAAVGKAGAEARERAERAAVQRAQAEARERAAAEAKERAERAAAEARERANAVAREKERDARARAERAAVERAAAEARERAAAAAARVNQQKYESQPKNENDLESFFSSRPSSAPRPRATSSDPFFDTGAKRAPEPPKSTSANSSASMRKASSATNIVDDLSSIFGAAGGGQSGEFQDIAGETEERRRARLERHQRTQERAAKALAEKNQRDLNAQMEQEERHRIAETLDFEIKRWSAGKEGNLRALLSTMQYVLWPECGWQPVSLTDLITAASVKKAYRKATLCIHPDKVQQKGANLQQKYIAEKVFDLLKEAWNKFNSEELF